MSIIDHRAVPETPWRPNYRMWHIAGPDQGVSSTLAYSQVSPGAGAPLHYHEADEIIVVLQGALEARLGDDVQRVGPDHTIVVPAARPPRLHLRRRRRRPRPRLLPRAGPLRPHHLPGRPTSRRPPQRSIGRQPPHPPLVVSLSNHTQRRLTALPPDSSFLRRQEPRGRGTPPPDVGAVREPPLRALAAHGQPVEPSWCECPTTGSPQLDTTRPAPLP